MREGGEREREGGCRVIIYVNFNTDHLNFFDEALNYYQKNVDIFNKNILIRTMLFKRIF